MSRRDDILTPILRAVRAALAEGPLERIELRHLHGSEEARASTFSGDRISGKGITAETIAEEILEEITEDSKVLTGSQVYALLFYRTGEHNYSRRKLITVRLAAEAISDRIEQTEAPNEKGVTAMSMRHLEVRDAQLTARERIVSAQYETLVTRLSSMVERLADVFPRVLEAEQSLIDRKEERKLNIRRAEKQDKMVERGVEKLMMYGGPLLQKLLPGPTGQALASDAMLINLVSSLDEKQLAVLMQTFSAEQRANFIELYNSLRARHESVRISETETETEKGESHG